MIVFHLITLAPRHDQVNIICTKITITIATISGKDTRGFAAPSVLLAVHPEGRCVSVCILNRLLVLSALNSCFPSRPTMATW